MHAEPRPVATREVETPLPPPLADPEVVGALDLLERTMDKMQPDTWLTNWGALGSHNRHCVLGWVSTLAGNESNTDYLAHLQSGPVTQRALRELHEAIRDLKLGADGPIFVNDHLGLDATRKMVRRAISRLRQLLGADDDEDA